MRRRISEYVQREPFLPGAEDAHGNEIEAWGPAVEVGILAFNPGGSTEPLTPGHDRVITVPTLFVPEGVTFGTRDKVTARGLLFEVEGDTAVWRHPNGLRPGNVINLKRVEG